MPNESYKKESSNIPEKPLTNALCEICFSADHKTSEHNKINNLIDKKDNINDLDIEKKYKPE